MEPRFGHDFTNVRVHSDPSAAESARAVGALAYTVGRDVVFGSGQYAPQVGRGRELLAHELAHVVQQASTLGTAPSSLEIGGAHSAPEQEAQAAARAVGANKEIVPAQAPVSGELARQEDITSPSTPANPEGTPLSPETSEKVSEQTQSPCRPKLKKIEALQTGAIAMMIGARGEVAAGECLLSFGMPGKVGMTFRSEVDVPEGCTGRLEYVQQVDTCRQLRDAAKVDYRLKSDGFVLDTRDPQMGQWVNSAGAKSFESSDSPGIGTEDDIYVSIQDYFHLWLLWRADKPADSPRVPLGVVGWHWKAKANKTDKTGDKTGKTGQTGDKTAKTSDCAKDWTISEEEVTGGPGMDVEYDTAPIPTRNVVDLVFSRGTC